MFKPWFNYHLLNRIRARSLLELRMQRRLGQLQVARLSAGPGSPERRSPVRSGLRRWCSGNVFMDCLCIWIVYD